MEIDEAVYNELTTDAGVFAIIGLDAFYEKVPQGKGLPYIYMQEISADRNPHQGGASGLAMLRLQVECLDVKPNAARALGKQVRLALNQFSGIMGGAGGVDVRSTNLENSFGDYDDDQSGGQLGISRHILEFRISYMEDIA